MMRRFWGVLNSSILIPVVGVLGLLCSGCAESKTGQGDQGAGTGDLSAVAPFRYTGLLVGLMQLPERLDTMLLVSTAIANLIGGLGRFLQGLLQLLAVLVLVLVAIGALLLLVAGLVRLLRSVLPGPAGNPATPRPRR